MKLGLLLILFRTIEANFSLVSKKSKIKFKKSITALKACKWFQILFNLSYSAFSQTSTCLLLHVIETWHVITWIINYSLLQLLLLSTYRMEQVEQIAAVRLFHSRPFVVVSYVSIILSCDFWCFEHFFPFKNLHRLF